MGGPQWGQRIGCRLHGTKHSFHDAIKCHEQVLQSHFMMFENKPENGILFRKGWHWPHCRCVWVASWYSVPCLMLPMVIGWSLSTFLPGALGRHFQMFHVWMFIPSGDVLFFLHGYVTGSSYHQLGPSVSFQMQNGILGCPKNWVNVLWPAYKMILVKNLQVYPAHVYIYIYMLQVYVGYGISRSHSHTLPVARDSMKTPPPKKGSCILCLGYTQQLDRSNKLKPISWSPGCLRTGFPFPGFSTLPICVGLGRGIHSVSFIYCRKLFCCENMVGTTSQH